MAQSKKSSSKRSAQSDIQPHEAPTLKPLSRLGLHPKWDQQLFSRGQAWISVRSEGTTIIGDCFDCKVIVPPDTAAPPCSAVIDGKSATFSCRSGFRVHSVTAKSIEVSYDQIPGIATRATFHAPQRIYEEVFRRNVVSVDVQTAGDYGAAVAVDKEGAKVLKVWRMDNEEIKCAVKDQGDINVVKWVPSSSVIAYSAESNLIRLYNVDKNKHLRTLRGHKSAIQELAFSERGKNLFSASQDGSLLMWDITRTEPIDIVAVHIADVINCVSVQTTPSTSEGPEAPGGDGRFLLYGTQDVPFLRIVGVSVGGGPVFEYGIEAPVVCCTFLQHPFFVCGTDNGQLYYFDWRRGDRPLAHWREIRGGVLSMVPLKEGVICSTADGSCVHRNPVKHRQNDVTMEFSGAEEPLMKVCQYQGHLVTACRDGKIRQYSLP